MNQPEIVRWNVLTSSSLALLFGLSSWAAAGGETRLGPIVE